MIKEKKGMFINIKTPAIRHWEMISKIAGKNINTTINHLEEYNDETKITERVDLTNWLAQEIIKNFSRKKNYCTKFQKCQEKAEKEH